MKKNYSLFLLIVLLFSCSEETKVVSPDSNPIVKGSIKGLVINKTTEMPVAGAFVTTLPLTSTTKTDEEGKFELPSVSPDIYDIIITHLDFVPYSNKIKVSDQITNDILFKMTSFASLNTPPKVPELIYPKEGNRIGFKSTNFRWEATDIDNDTLKYVIYFGEANTELNKIAENVIENELVFEYNFKEGVDYQWYITAKDKYTETKSQIVTFSYKEILITNIPNLIGLWKLNGEAVDYSPNNYIGDLENVAFIQDRKGQSNGAAYFKGNSKTLSKILLPTTLQLTNEFTISLWVKQDSSLGENSNVGNFECVSKWGNSRSSWAFGINKDNFLFLSTYSIFASTVSASITKVPTDSWQHIAVTFLNGNVTFYLNGTFIYSANGMEIPQISSYQASIGARQNQLSSFHGAIDDVYLFERVLTEQELLKLWQE